MIRMLNDKEKFKLENLRNWHKNTDYWLNNPLRQVEDTKEFFKSKLKDLILPNMSILDMGCGSGWLLDFLIELQIPFTYKGIDFNKKFINHLNKKYLSLTNASFEIVDFEQEIPVHLINEFDLVFNCFNFFETANLDNAFDNAQKMKKEQGKLIIFTIDNMYLILGVSKTMEDLKTNLYTYERLKNKNETPYFFQKIDFGDSESENLKYASVLYSIGDYYKKAKEYDMNLIDYGEIVKTSKFIPKIYHYIVFQ